MPEPSVNRRVTPPKPTEELYSLSKKEIASFIEEERRHDELSRRCCQTKLKSLS